MTRKSNLDWTETLSEDFLAYQAGRRIEEVECIIPDIAGISRGKAMPAHKFKPDESFYLPISLFYETISGGYVELDIKDQWMESDMVLRPDMSTACAVAWADDATLQVINDLTDREGNPIEIAPRNVLRRIVKLYEDRGWKPVVAPELEFYLTKPNIDPNEPIEPPVTRTGRKGASRQSYSMRAIDDHGPVIDTIYDYAEAMGLEIDTLIQEGGAGQVEINLNHGDPIALADQVFFFKRAIREAALKHGVFATFMAKPMRDQPGSAMHVHQSVVDMKTGQNIFSDEQGAPTEEFYHFIGGSQKHLPALTPMLAPYVNSYRRLRAAESSPTNLEWARDNRTTGLRIPHSPAEARRVENRVIGIDTNPYIAIAASLAAGWLGMVHQTAPREPASGEIYQNGEHLPLNLDDALDLFAEAREARALLGETFCTVYEGIKREEMEEFHREISPWEREHLLLNV